MTAESQRLLRPVRPPVAGRRRVSPVDHSAL